MPHHNVPTVTVDQVPDDATVQPARLALGLRRRLLERGVAVHEHSRVRALRVAGASSVCTRSMLTSSALGQNGSEIAVPFEPTAARMRPSTSATITRPLGV